MKLSGSIIYNLIDFSLTFNNIQEPTNNKKSASLKIIIVLKDTLQVLCCFAPRNNKYFSETVIKCLKKVEMKN